jgi:hypothetical protein
LKIQGFGLHDSPSISLQWSRADNSLNNSLLEASHFSIFDSRETTQPLLLSLSSTLPTETSTTLNRNFTHRTLIWPSNSSKAKLQRTSTRLLLDVQQKKCCTEGSESLGVFPGCTILSILGSSFSMLQRRNNNSLPSHSPTETFSPTTTFPNLLKDFKPQQPPKKPLAFSIKPLYSRIIYFYLKFDDTLQNC